MRKHVFVFVLCVFALGYLSAAGSQSAEQGGAVGDDNFNSTGYPIVKEKITLRAFGNQNVTHADWDTLICFNDYEEKSNIHIEWITAPNQGFAEKKNVLLASGDYPDIFYRAKLSTADEINYGSMGVLVPLNDLLNRYSVHLKKHYTENPSIKAQMTMPDGNIYTLPFIKFSNLTLPQKPWINKAWLDRLGLPVPSTLEELHYVFTAFKEEDANGNGDPNDELPYSDRAKGLSIFNALYGAFGMGSLGSSANDQYVDLGPRGKIRFFADTPEFKKLIEYIKGLATDELLDMEMFVQGIPEFTAKGEQNRIGAFFQNGTNYIIGTRYYEDYVSCPAFEGPDGHREWNYVAKPVNRGTFAITNVNQYPRESLRWVDFYYSEEGNRLIRMGREGLTYHVDESGNYYLDDTIMNNPDGLSRVQAIGQYAISWAGAAVPTYLYPKHEVAMFADDTSMIEGAEMLSRHMIPFSQVIDFTFTVEEQKRLNALSSDIVNYVKEMKVKFAVGQTPLSEWDNYVKTLQNMGVSEYVEIYQKAYDRYLAYLE